MERVPDETLDYLAERFIAEGLAETMSFEQFLCLSPALRERRIEQLHEIRRAQQIADRATPPDATVHGDRLIDPLHHGPREFRRPVFYRRRRHA